MLSQYASNQRVAGIVKDYCVVPPSDVRGGKVYFTLITSENGDAVTCLYEQSDFNSPVTPSLLEMLVNSMTNLLNLNAEIIGDVEKEENIIRIAKIRIGIPRLDSY